MGASEKMIEIENVSKVFRTELVETVALNRVNMQVKEGEFVAIMGPSGCGKSTLLSILGLLTIPPMGSTASSAPTCRRCARRTVPACARVNWDSCSRVSISSTS
jgi:ABC-type lipoprotein export system ATPase subunit